MGFKLDQTLFLLAQWQGTVWPCKTNLRLVLSLRLLNQFQEYEDLSYTSSKLLRQMLENTGAESCLIFRDGRVAAKGEEAARIASNQVHQDLDWLPYSLTIIQWRYWSIWLKMLICDWLLHVFCPYRVSEIIHIRPSAFECNVLDRK